MVGTASLGVMSESCTLDIETVKGAKNIFLGGEGLFHTRITGPGKIWLQSMPAAKMAQAIQPHLTLGGDNDGGINIKLGD